MQEDVCYIHSSNDLVSLLAMYCVCYMFIHLNLISYCLLSPDCFPDDAENHYDQQNLGSDKIRW